MTDKMTTALAMLSASGKQKDRLKLLVSPQCLGLDWRDSEFVTLCDEVVDQFFQDNFLMFCQDIRNSGILNQEWATGSATSAKFLNYLFEHWSKWIDGRDKERSLPHVMDVLTEVKFIYLLSTWSPVGGKANQLVRLCGEKLDLFWLDNFCRRHIDLKYKWECEFRILLANGMISRNFGSFWDHWDLLSGLVIDQSDPLHYSREALLKDWINTLIKGKLEKTPDGQRLLGQYIEELIKRIGRDEVVKFVKPLGIVENLVPKEK